MMPFGERFSDEGARAGPAGRGDGENPHFSGIFLVLGVGMLNQPFPSKAGELGLFPWRVCLGLELGSDVVSHEVLLFALIMEWKRKIKKVKEGSVLLDLAFIKLRFWRLLPGALPVASSLFSVS